MKKLYFFFVTIFLVSSMSSQVLWQFNKDTVVTWQYEWGDEFNDKEINTDKWMYWYGWARSIYGNKEQQYYSEGKNHVLENGVLKLVARKESVTEKMVDWLPETDTIKNEGKFYSLNMVHFNYTSGMIKSNVEFTYGFFEIRLKAPKDKGMWPAFWLYGGTPNEEIDIMELKGDKPNKTHVDTHCANECDYFRTWYGEKLNWGGWVNLNNSLQEGFNVVAAEWEPNFVKYYVNGKCIAISKVSFNVKKALVANMAIADDHGPFHPGPDKSLTKFIPFEIDYIRVWNKAELKARAANPQINVTKVDVSDLAVGTTTLKKKDKYLYGKKLDHKMEGIIVSLLPSTDKNYILYISGLEVNKEVKIELNDKNGKNIYAASSKDFQTKLDFSKISAGEYRLIISYEGKKAEREIQL